MREEEIDDLIEKLITRNADFSDIKLFLSSIVRSKTFTEDFLLKYFEYLEIEDIKELHNPQICSGEYGKITLLITAKESI